VNNSTYGSNVCHRLCPRCLNRIDEHPALSRRDNESEICSHCGREEAVVDMFNSIHEEIPPDQKIKEERMYKYLTQV